MHRIYNAALPASSTETPHGAIPRLAIRPLVPSDEPEMFRFLERLEPRARFDRFGCEMDDAALESHARACLATSPAVFGALLDGSLAGIAEITRFTPDNSAILAFAVDANWRRQGIGCRLLLAALEWADRQAMTSVQLQCTRTNWAVRQIARKANARIDLAAGKFLAEFDARPEASFALIAR